MKVIVVGGGWAGCAAAFMAAKQGAEVVLAERTDMVLGTGLVGGIMRNNGRFTAAEEMIALAGGDLFKLIDSNCLHRGIEFPGHRHVSLYNVATMEPLVRKAVLARGVDLRLITRIEDVATDGRRIVAVSGKEAGEKVRFEGDVFIDTTGTAGPPSNCTRHGNGCAMCILRCPSFGGRVSLAGRAGVQEIVGKKGEQIGAMSGSCKLLKESLSRELVDELNEKGVVVVRVPESDRVKGKLAIKACQQYALPDFEENVILLDTGHAKLMVPYFPLDALRRIPGFEHARYEDPYAGGIGNSIRFIGMSPRDDALRVAGIENLLCAGEKAGLLVGHTEAIVTGTLAGFNAVKLGKGEKVLVLPESLAVGDAISHVRTRMASEEGLGLKVTFSGSVYFQRMKERHLYSTDRETIRKRVDEAGLTNLFA